MQIAGARPAGGTVLIASDGMKLFLLSSRSGRSSVVDYFFPFCWDENFNPSCGCGRADLTLGVLATCANAGFCLLDCCEMVDVGSFRQLLHTL